MATRPAGRTSSSSSTIYTTSGSASRVAGALAYSGKGGTVAVVSPSGQVTSTTTYGSSGEVISRTITPPSTTVQEQQQVKIEQQKQITEARSQREMFISAQLTSPQKVSLMFQDERVATKPSISQPIQTTNIIQPYVPTKESYRASNVALKEMFTIPKKEKYESYLKESGKVSPSAFVQYSLDIGFPEWFHAKTEKFKPISEKVIGKKATEFVFEKQVPIKINLSETAKFIGFAPYLATGQEVLSREISAGRIVPEIQTRFVSEITGKQMKTYAITESGGLKQVSLTNQQIKQLGEKTVISKGTMTSVSSLKPNTFITYRLIGVGQEIGKAKIVTEFAGLKISKDIGKGIESISVIQKAGTTERGIVFPTGELITKTVKEPSYFLKTTIKGFKPVTTAIKTPKITGAITPIKENLFSFVGGEQTTKRLVSSGFAKIIRQPEIKGIIKISGEKAGAVSFGVPLIQQQKFAGNIATQVSAIKGSFQQTMIKSLPSQLPLFSISVTKPITKVTTTTTQLQKETQGIVSYPRQFQQPLVKTQLKQISGIGSLFKQAQQGGQKQQYRLQQREAISLAPIQRIMQKQEQQQKQKLITTTLLKQKQVTRPRVPFIITSITPSRKTKIGGLLTFKTPSLITTTRGGLFGVAVKRKGKFKSVGRGTLPQAISIGTGITSRTLATTFKITPLFKGTYAGGIRTPAGYYQKKGLIFVEKRGRRLSTPTEIFGIQRARRSKRGRR